VQLVFILASGEAKCNACLYWVWLGWTYLSSSQLVWCWFRLVTKTVLITHRCFSFCWTVLAQRQGLLLLCPQQVGWGWARGWEGTQPAHPHPPKGYSELPLLNESVL